MRFSVDTKIFRQAVEVVSHACTGGTFTPILENVLLTTSMQKLTLTGNNLEMAIEFVVEDPEQVKVFSEGSFTISSKFLSSYLALVNEEKMEVELLSDSAFSFKTPHSETKFKGIEASKFPVIPGFKRDASFAVDAKNLKEAIEKTIFSTAQGNIRPTLAGIYLSVKEDSIIFASTDSFRLSEYVIKNTKPNAPVAIILPTKTAYELLRILPEGGNIDVLVSESQLMIMTQNIRMFSRLLNGHFPDYQVFFPKGFNTKGVIARTELAQALKRINLISRENNFNTRMSFSSEKGIELSTGDTEVGASRVQVPASIQGEDATIGMNSTYLLEAL